MYINQQQPPGQYYYVPDQQNIMYPPTGMIPMPMPVYPGYPGYMQQPYNPYNQDMDTTMPPDVGFEEGPPTLTDIGYTPAYLKTQIGRRVKIEFILGTNMLVDREGTLIDVGINYVIIREAETDDLLLCDLYSIKFVKFYY